MSAQHTRGPWHVFSVYAMHEVRTPTGTLVTVVGNREDARLISAVLDLLEALQWREQFERRPGEDANDTFERVAEVFRRETGYLRPGKDCRIDSHEVRSAAWDAWMEAGRARVRAAIAKATTT